jgi:hypothetical protein
LAAAVRQEPQQVMHQVVATQLLAPSHQPVVDLVMDLMFLAAPLVLADQAAAVTVAEAAHLARAAPATRRLRHRLKEQMAAMAQLAESFYALEAAAVVLHQPEEMQTLITMSPVTAAQVLHHQSPAHPLQGLAVVGELQPQAPPLAPVAQVAAVGVELELQVRQVLQTQVAVVVVVDLAAHLQTAVPAALASLSSRSPIVITVSSQLVLLIP